MLLHSSADKREGDEMMGCDDKMIKRDGEGDLMPHNKETLDNCLKLCAELRRMGFDENSLTTSIIPEEALATATYNQRPLSPQGLEQARYAGIYLVEYRFLEALGNSEYRLTGKDLMMPRNIPFNLTANSLDGTHTHQVRIAPGADWLRCGCGSVWFTVAFAEFGDYSDGVIAQCQECGQILEIQKG